MKKYINAPDANLAEAHLAEKSHDKMAERDGRVDTRFGTS
jgi:hypothetical protein